MVYRRILSTSFAQPGPLCINKARNIEITSEEHFSSGIYDPMVVIVGRDYTSRLTAPHARTYAQVPLARAVGM